jgi:hypothetical protein
MELSTILTKDATREESMLEIEFRNKVFRRSKSVSSFSKFKVSQKLFEVQNQSVAFRSSKSVSSFSKFKVSQKLFDDQS